MDWTKTRGRTSELLLIIGLFIIIAGFIDLLKLSGWQLIVSGFIVTSLGTYEILKNIKTKSKK